MPITKSLKKFSITIPAVLLVAGVSTALASQPLVIRIPEPKSEPLPKHLAAVSDVSGSSTTLSQYGVGEKSKSKSHKNTSTSKKQDITAHKITEHHKTKPKKTKSKKPMSHAAQQLLAPAGKIDKAHQSKPVKKAVLVKASHPEVKITLPANPSTGYRWMLGYYPATLIEPVSETYLPPKRQLAGAAGHVVWVFKVKPIAFKVTQLIYVNMIYAQSWNLDPKSIKHKSLIIVTDQQ